MSCLYSDEELEIWDSVCNPMGEPCYSCEEWECGHNANLDSPNIPEEELEYYEATHR